MSLVLRSSTFQPIGGKVLSLVLQNSSLLVGSERSVLSIKTISPWGPHLKRCFMIFLHYFIQIIMVWITGNDQWNSNVLTLTNVSK